MISSKKDYSEILLNKAYLLLKKSNKLNNPSASYLQRKLGITWKRADKILKQLVEKGLISADYKERNFIAFRKKHHILIDK